MRRLSHCRAFSRFLHLCSKYSGDWFFFPVCTKNFCFAYDVDLRIEFVRRHGPVQTCVFEVTPNLAFLPLPDGPLPKS